ARKRASRSDVTLEEAPAGLLVEGEGAADAVGLAGGLARIERRILADGIVVARQVGARQQGHAAFGRGSSGDGKCKKESSTQPQGGPQQQLHFALPGAFVGDPMPATK